MSALNDRIHASYSWQEICHELTVAGTPRTRLKPSCDTTTTGRLTTLDRSKLVKKVGHMPTEVMIEIGSGLGAALALLD